MRALLGSLLGENAAVDTPADTWISPRPDAGKFPDPSTADAGESGRAEGWRTQLRERLRTPLGLPALTDSAFPGDRIVLSLDPETPHAEAMALDDFNECVSLEDVTVLLGSSNGRAFNRIGVQIGPYVAGPYVEGSWEFTLPVTADVFAAVKPEYSDAFAVRN